LVAYFVVGSHLLLPGNCYFNYFGDIGFFDYFRFHPAIVLRREP
jgi:hypothetical protein